MTETLGSTFSEDEAYEMLVVVRNHYSQFSPYVEQDGNVYKIMTDVPVFYAATLALVRTFVQGFREGWAAAQPTSEPVIHVCSRERRNVDITREPL